MMMKSILTAVVALGLFASSTAWGQQTFAQRVQAIQARETAQADQAASPPSFTKFDLDFPGGTPADLVAAIEEATGKPLNAIIPTEHADVQLPPLKMANVTAPRLFESLQASSLHHVRYETGYGFGPQRYQISNVAYGFRNAGTPDGDDTIWHFFVEGLANPPPKPKECRYYQLAPYLESYSVDDITTAIQTGWRMLGEKAVPELSFHKETKLLIAVGDQGDLALIDDVLKQLSGSPKGPPPAKAKAEQTK